MFIIEMRILLLNIILFVFALNAEAYYQKDRFRRYYKSDFYENSLNGDEKSKATFAIRIGQRGLRFVSAIANKIVGHELPRIQFPPFTFSIVEGPGSGTGQVKDLNIKKFKSPDFTLAFDPPDRILMESANGAFKINGNWSAQYHIVTTIYTDGWLNVFVSGISTRVEICAYGDEKRPQFRIIDCSVSLGEFRLNLGGGVIPWLVNLFHSGLSELVKTEIHTQFCTLARTTLMDQLNEQLLALPSKIPIANSIYVDYKYTNDPIVKSNEIIYSAFMDVTIGNVSCGSMISYPDPIPPPEPPQSRNHYMATVWIAPTILKCLAKSIYKTNVMQLVVDENFDSGKFSTFLSARCAFYEVCLGKFLSKFAESYPNDHMALRFHLARPAVVNMILDQINLDTSTFVDFHISPYEKNPEILARIDLNANLSINPQIIDDKIGGTLNDEMQLIFSEVFSKIGSIHESVLNLFAAMFGPVLRVLVDAQLRVGLPIPVIENIAISDGARFTTLNDGVLRVDFDLSYIADAIANFQPLN